MTVSLIWLVEVTEVEVGAALVEPASASARVPKTDAAITSRAMNCFMNVFWKMVSQIDCDRLHA
jgi:hypothetical protein